MFAKVLYFRVFGDDFHELARTEIHECDTVVNDHLTGRIVSLHRHGYPDTIIDLDEMGKTAVTIYLMNDQGETIDSFELR